MADVKATFSEYVPASTTKTVHSGAGQLYAIIVATTSSSTVSVSFWDNTAASGNTLLVLNVNQYRPSMHLQFPAGRPLRFSTGLTIVTPANATCHVTLVA